MSNNPCDKAAFPLTLDKKLLLTKYEAAAYSNIGINKIEAMLRTPNCPFALYIGTKKLVKRREFEEYISQKTVI
nr:excisionase [uncultured Dysosmobacter sp.]